jgi:hypothetical protein
MIMIVLMLIDSKPGINFNPSTAESIDIAGVITPSPRSKETPMYPRKDMKPTFSSFFERGYQNFFKNNYSPFSFGTHTHCPTMRIE